MRRRSMLRAAIVAATAMITATMTIQQADAAPGWRVSLLPLPDGYDEATLGHLGGTDGRGDYAGTLVHDGTTRLVLWTHRKPAVQQVPAGYSGASVSDENGAGVVVGATENLATNLPAPFVLDHDGLRFLPPPTGTPAQYYGVTAINNRGDIVGYGAVNGTTTQNVLWPADDYAHPVVLPLAPGWTAAGIDGDGTVLLNGNSQSALWKNGQQQVFASATDGKSPYAVGIKSGRIAGVFADYTSSRCVFWPSTDSPRDLTDCSAAYGLNRFGLVVGAGPRPSQFTPGPLSAWLGPQPLGALPIPAGFARGDAHKVGDDGTIAGIVTNGDPTYTGGRPAIWRWSLD